LNRVTTNSSTAKPEEKQEERGVRRALINIPLRSIMKDLRQQDIQVMLSGQNRRIAPPYPPQRRGNMI